MIPSSPLALRSEDLMPLWDACQGRVTETGGMIAGRVRLRALTMGQRDAISRLLGHHVGPSATIDLEELDTELRDGAVGGGLAEVLETVYGAVAVPVSEELPATVPTAPVAAPGE